MTREQQEMLDAVFRATTQISIGAASVLGCILGALVEVEILSDDQMESVFVRAEAHAQTRQEGLPLAPAFVRMTRDSLREWLATIRASGTPQ